MKSLIFTVRATSSLPPSRSLNLFLQKEIRKAVYVSRPPFLFLVLFLISIGNFLVDDNVDNQSDYEQSCRAAQNHVVVNVAGE